jgi:glucosyl-dolichyl phosphate glucuronosyltransferase
VITIQATYDISVIICSYTDDRWDDLVAAVESVKKQSLPANEIIVVIDHNSELLKRAKECISEVIIIENKEELGLSGARNSGIAVAGSQIIAFLDDDATAIPDWLMLLSKEFTDLQVLGVGGAVLPFWADSNPAWLPEEFYWVVGCSYRGRPQTIGKVRNLIGANMSFRREVFDSVGGFRNGIGRIGTKPIAGEEMELCVRASQRWPQGIFLYQPQATVFHRVPRKRVSWQYFCSRCYAEGLSKALITPYVGVKDGLESEFTYMVRTLSWGIMRSLAETFFHCNPSGLLRAGAILVGLVVTMAGYVLGSFSQLFVLNKGVRGKTKRLLLRSLK